MQTQNCLTYNLAHTGVNMINNVSTQSAGGNQQKDYSPLPNGDYAVTVDRVTEKSTKAGNGTLIDVSFKVNDGDNKGRLLFNSFLISHPNPKASSIGLQQLDRFLKAVGHFGGFEALGSDSTQLEGFIGRDLIVSTEIESNPGYKDRNKIKRYNRA